MKRTRLKTDPEKVKAWRSRSKPLKAKKQSFKSVKQPKPRRTVKRNKDGSMAKSERIRILKKKLWKVFSQYIRLSWADQTGYLTTVDGVTVHWKECDCGHLWHNSDRNALLGGNELWYYENNFAPQSNNGNRLNADDSAQKYMLWAVKTYGQDEVDKMWKMKQTPKKWTESELEAKYQHYKSLVDTMMV